ncbi:MAG: cysteine desulfurase family protein [Bacteroidia bacterium]
MNVYFDNAATTPIHPQVVDVMYKVMAEEFGNPSSIHAPGRKVRAMVEEARRTVAKILNCAPGEIFFTSGGTEADNMAIRKSVDDFSVKNIITSAIEHHAVLHTVEELAIAGKIKMHLVNILPNGHIDLTHLEELLGSNQNVLVSLMHANNEIGNMLDIEAVGNLCKKYGALFHTDTVQTIGHFKFDLQKLNINFLACAAHKFNGPKGVGFIYINNNTKLHPFITGGAQERNMRGGTENVYGIVGLAKALQIADENFENEKKHILSLKNYMMQLLEDSIDGISYNGDAKGVSNYTVLNVCFPETSVAEMLLYKLDIAGIAASGGSACSSGSNKGSHVLTALGVNPKRPSVRFSFGYQNTKNEVDYVVNVLKEIFEKEKNKLTA